MFFYIYGSGYITFLVQLDASIASSKIKVLGKISRPHEDTVATVRPQTKAC